MKKLIENNYKITVDRGKIAPYTNLHNFLHKIKEEVAELEIGVFVDHERDVISDYTKLELADVILTCLNMAKHYNIDIEQEMKNKIEINRQRIGCGNCEDKYICGGCRARAYSYFKGNINAPDIGCIDNEEIWKKAARIASLT